MNLGRLIFEHLYMVTVSVTIASLIAIPLAILVFKKNFHVNFFLNFVSLFQSFPALGMFAILVPIIGIGMKTVIFALMLYSLLPIFQNTILGFKNINPEYYEIINSANIAPDKVFKKIELPLIIPNIVNGIRLSIIYTISFATIGTLVGAGGLGDLIYLGLQTLNLKFTMAGIIPLLIMTILTNILFNAIEEYFYTPDYKAMLKQEEYNDKK